MCNPRKFNPSLICTIRVFSFTESQAACLKELFYSWSGIGFQYFPCRGRCHKVIGIAHDGYPFVVPFATGWGFGASIGIFGVEQPFHPIQCHICQHWGTHSLYKVANFFFRGRTLQDEGRPERQY